MKKLSLILLYFFIFSCLMVFLIPPFEANDEPDHLAYINFVSSKGALPNQTVDSLKVNKEGHQFPLYYLIASCMEKLYLKNEFLSYDIIPNKKNINYGGTENLVPVYNHAYHEIFRTEKDKIFFYSMRIFQVLISIVNLVFIYKISGYFFRDEKFKLLTVFIAASVPQFAFVSSYINNDSLANLFSTLIIFAFLKMVNEKKLKSIVIFSVIFSVGILVKKTLFFFLPVILFVTLIMLTTKKLKWNEAIKIYSTIFISLSIFAAWFFIRNYYLYNDVFLANVEMKTVPYYVDMKSVFSLYFLYPFIPGLFGSFWGVFGWLNVALPFFTYVLLFLFCSFAVYFALTKVKLVKLYNINVLIGFLTIIFCFSGVVYYNTIYSQHQGRFLFPVISFIVIFLVYGIKTAFEKFNHNENLIRAVVFFFLFLDIISIFTIKSFYYNINQYL